MNRKTLDFLIIIVCLFVGLLGGRIIIERWDSTVNNEVESVLSKVEMLDVPPIDVEVSKYLITHEYKHKYITAIDISDKTYGIYEIFNNNVKAYAHGKCLTTGDATPGIYYIEDTISHLDVENVRYWRVVDMTGGLIVTSGGYEIGDLPEVPVETDGFGNIMIESGIMLSVYDNSEPGIALIVIESKKNEND